MGEKKREITITKCIQTNTVIDLNVLLNCNKYSL